MEMINGQSGEIHLMTEDGVRCSIEKVSVKYEGQPNNQNTWSHFQKEISGTLTNIQINPELKQFLFNHRLSLLAHKAHMFKKYGG